MFEGKTIVLGVTGSIAAYKAVDLASKLVQAGIGVDVVMTDSAAKFVTPLSFRSITHRPVHTDMFAPVADFNIEHVALAERADTVVIAPATANTIAKLATGLADDLLSCTVLATKAPLILAPAMDVGMYQNQVTQENLGKLRSRGYIIVGPAHGRLASGLEGMGRLVEVSEILAAIHQVLGRSGDLAGKRLVVTAGGTQEPIDPVRYIGNYSSGKMGYAVAEAARNRGAIVTLISASTTVPPPLGIDVVQVQTALQMRKAVIEKAAGADTLIMAAAVADYQPLSIAGDKIKRQPEKLSLELMKTPDILSEVSGDLIKVGFAAESEELIENATSKLKAKGLDLIVANDITDADSGFGVDTNRVILIDRSGKVDHLPLMSKLEVAHKILDRVAKLLTKKS
ncbi:MAG: bifunctional phosphopantothenoylcysteine decarboxylase/phosphopantothenate--cysteine ligase CoaBC [Chloroflexi bacterium CG07_land_8_20_14_0_80_51_10]|nr:MAG: bifunctional phosphopantothenoylcysteine decarboxylase/phosphopantothenate--cysteine ligase CoaBC [Chloroflexi bacterium CG07_land_8_20_14_0_80_51_10]